jgi:hypothetical protein
MHKWVPTGLDVESVCGKFTTWNSVFMACRVTLTQNCQMPTWLTMWEQQRKFIGSYADCLSLIRSNPPPRWCKMSLSSPILSPRKLAATFLNLDFLFANRLPGLLEVSIERWELPDFWFQTFALFWMLYAFFWVIPRCLNCICQRFETLCLFHLHRRIGMKNNCGWECWGIYTGKGLAQAIFEPNIFPYKYSNIFKPSYSSYLPAYEDRVFQNVGI